MPALPNTRTPVCAPRAQAQAQMRALGARPAIVRSPLPERAHMHACVHARVDGGRRGGGCSTVPRRGTPANRVALARLTGIQSRVDGGRGGAGVQHGPPVRGLPPRRPRPGASPRRRRRRDMSGSMIDGHTFRLASCQFGQRTACGGGGGGGVGLGRHRCRGPGCCHESDGVAVRARGGDWRGGGGGRR